jgi:hypothetical protein
MIQPTFVTHLPKELVPLAKLSPDDPTTVEVFECCTNGQEIAPGYTEQNDPIAQRNTLEHQAGGERQKLDEDFLVALEHGMPPGGRHRHRHRPPLHDAPRPGKHPRRDSLPAVEAEVSRTGWIPLSSIRQAWVELAAIWRMNTAPEPSLLGHCWRVVRRIVIVSATLGAFVTMFYLFENWRGHYAWKHLKAELAARGERLKPSDYTAASVPAEQNFAETPVLRAITYRSNMDSNLFRKFELVHRSLSYFPNGTEPVSKENADKVLAAFQNIAAEMAELRAATKCPYAQFPKTNDNAFLGDVPNFITLRTLSHLFSIHASAELVAGHSERARADIAVVQRLADSLRGKTTLVEAMIRVSVLGLTLPPFEEGLRAGAWSDAELAAFQKSFESEELLTGLDAAMRGGERNSITELVAELPRARLMETIGGNGPQNWKTDCFNLAVRWCPRGWLEQNAVKYSQVMQHQFDVYDVKQQRVFPDKCDATSAFIDAELKTMTPYKYLVALGMPNFAKATQITAERQIYLQEATLACALERFRRARGEYPEALAALVPQFIARLPTDVMTGQALKYQRADKDKFTLYSVGWNLKDDGGIRTSNRIEGDWVWPPARL